MVVITASSNSSGMGHTKTISVGRDPPITVFHIQILHAGEKETFPPLNNAQITKLKHLTLVSLAMERRVSMIIGRHLQPLREYIRTDSTLRGTPQFLTDANDTRSGGFDHRCHLLGRHSG